MGMRQRLGGLEPPCNDLGDRQRLVLLLGLSQDLRQAAALDELHRVVMNVAVAANGEDRHDVGMVQPRDGLGFAAEALHRLKVGHGREPQHLERHFALERRLLGLVDNPHAAAADLTDDAELAQGRRAEGRRAGRSLDEIDPGQTGLKLSGQLRMRVQQLPPVWCLAGLERSQVPVENLGQNGATRRVRRFRPMSARAPAFVHRFVWLSHL